MQFSPYTIVSAFILGPVHHLIGVSGTLSGGDRLNGLLWVLRFHCRCSLAQSQSTLVSLEPWTILDDTRDIDLCTEEILE